MNPNRSRPPGPVVPVLVYDDVGDAIEWLCRTFGFTERFRYGPPDAPVGAFLNVGEGSVGLTSSREGLAQPRPDVVTHSVHVLIDDVDAHHEAAKRNGARLLNEPTTHPFGERQYTAEDVAGHRWTFSQSVNDVAITDWGGQPGEVGR